MGLYRPLVRIKSGRKLIFFIFVMLALIACQKTEQITKPNTVYILTCQWRASAFVYASDSPIKSTYMDKFTKASKLLSSGIIGPVKLLNSTYKKTN